MLKSLQGKTVIVTGASKGIGRGIAKRFGQAGLNVLVVSRHLDEAKKVAGEIGANAIIGVRYDANEVAAGVTEVLAYGTAVVMEQGSVT